MKKILFFLLLITSFTYGQQLAFPSAKGAGAYATGGRGGQIIKVTNLNASGSGSLLEALQTTGPRVIVFEVGGTIDWRTVSGFYVEQMGGSNHDNVTIAGQTAPGGITIEGYSFMFNRVDNVVMRYIRNKHVSIADKQEDGAIIRGSNIIFDHCSWQGGKDEIISPYDSSFPMGMVTLQRNLIGNGKTGMIFGGQDVQDGDITGEDNDFSMVENLFVDISHRFPNPFAKQDSRFDIIGNVIYAAKLRYMSIYGEDGQNNEDVYIDLNYVNNYHKISSFFSGVYGNYYDDNFHQISEYGLNTPNKRLHAGGNIVTGTDASAQWITTPKAHDPELWTNFNFAFGGDQQWNRVPLLEFSTGNGLHATQLPILGQSWSLLTAEQAYTSVTGDVGANAYLNDSHVKTSYSESQDNYFIQKVINDTATDHGGWEESLMQYSTHSGFTRPANWDDDNDGMPDTWEVTTFGDTTSQSSWGDHDSDGIPNLEEYLNIIDGAAVVIDVTGVTVSPSSATVNIPDTEQLTRTITPNDATNQSGVWSSSNGAVATVDQAGLVTPVSVGSATITYTANDTSQGVFTDTSVITVTQTVNDLVSVDVTPNNQTLTTLDQVQMSVAYTPTNATDQTGVWSSDATSIATVDSNGLVTPLQDGTVNITFTPTDQTNSAVDTTEFVISLPTGDTVVIQLNCDLCDIKEKISTGETYSSNVELLKDYGYPYYMANGFHFYYSGVPSGKTVENSYLTFTNYNPTEGTGSGNLVIKIEDSPNPTVYTLGDYDISNRTYRGTTIPWNNVEEWTVSEQTYQSVDISSLIQLHIDDPSYNPLNPINIVVEWVSGEGTRSAYPYNYDDTKAVTLTITYDEGAGLIPVESVSVQLAKTSLFVGQGTFGTEMVLPGNSSDKTGVWTSSDINVATVDANGNISTYSEGFADITFTTNDGGFNDTVRLFVTAPSITEKIILTLKRIIGQ